MSLTDHIRNLVRGEAVRMQAARAPARWGVVTNYNPSTYCAKVTLQPDGALTGYLPVGVAWVGSGGTANQWGMFAPPNIGDLVEVQFMDDSGTAGFIVSRFYSSVNPPLSVPSGEWWLVHSSGSFIKFTNDGHVTLTDGTGSTILLSNDKKVTLTDGSGSTVIMNGDHTGTMTFSSGLTIDANIQVNGSVTATEEITAKSSHTVSAHTHTQGNDSHGDTEAATNAPTG
jgi:phage baseplate assembly protein gpV